MILNKRKRSEAEISQLKKQKAERIKEIIGNSLLVVILMIFALMLIFYTLELMGVDLSRSLTKMIWIGASLIVAATYLFKRLRAAEKCFNLSDSIIKYRFVITEFYAEPISNTEFSYYACRTSEKESIIFLTEKIDTVELLDTLEIETLGDKIISLSNYSSGTKVRKIELEIDFVNKYGNEFYLLDMDIQDL